MRNRVCELLVSIFDKEPFIFLTGDLGYNALEPLRDKMGSRFINAGVAEQNMISVAAGLALSGNVVLTYSIASFLYARPFEQIRNDVCLHNLPVKLVGNGGGYAYGPMGATHHAIEDYGALLSLQNMEAFVPAFSDDLDHIIPEMIRRSGPDYLRLGRCEKPEGFSLPDYAPWRRILPGGGPVLVVAGPLAGPILARALEMDEDKRPEIWVVSQLPVGEYPPPQSLLESITSRQWLIVAEEHVSHGGLGNDLLGYLASEVALPKRFDHRRAHGYPSGLYGSQAFHRKENGLDAESIIALATGALEW